MQYPQWTHWDRRIKIWIDYAGLLRGYQQSLSRFVGPTEVLVSGDTLQLNDYGKTDWEWSMFDPEAKRLRHKTVFPQERKRAFDMGAALFKGEGA